MNNTYILRNKITGLFFDGTNFSAESATQAKKFDVKPDQVVLDITWLNASIIEVTAQQWSKLELSEKLYSRAEAHNDTARRMSDYNAAPLRSAATRLRRRATAVAVEVYSTFGNYGRRAA